MAHDATAYVRARYLPVTGDEVTRSAPSDGVDGMVTVGRRRKWWWQSGPVDSCYFFLTLDAGIAVLAGLILTASCIALVKNEPAKAATNDALKRLANSINTLVATIRQNYENGCTGDSPTMSKNNCQQLGQIAHDLQDAVSSFEDKQAIAYLYEYLVYIIRLMGLAGGVVGLWAGCGRNTLAAKLFFWSRLTDLLLRTASMVVFFAAGHLGRLTITSLVTDAYIYFFKVYFIKVSWSYYAVLKARDVSTSSGVGSGVELRGIYDGDGRSYASV